MNVESWMVTSVIAGLGAAVTYGIFRNRVTRNEKDFEKHTDEYAVYKKDTDRRISASFSKIDVLVGRVITLEQDTSTHLDLVKAEEKFVSKKELELHLKNIELSINNISSKVADTNNKVDKIEGKLGELVEILTECRLDTAKDK